MSTFTKHLAAVIAGKITKANVIGMRKAINAFERASARLSISSTQPKWTAEEMQQMTRALRATEPQVMGELHETGIKVLRNPRYARRWNEMQRGVIDRLDHFKLVGFAPAGRWHVVPLFRAVATTGQSFLFYNIPWQTAHYQGLESGPQIVVAKP